jgi:hypothetical protein
MDVSNSIENTGFERRTIARQTDNEKTRQKFRVFIEVLL